MKLFLLILLLTFQLFAQDTEIIESKYYLDSEDSLSVENVYEEKDKFLELKYDDSSFGVTDDTCWIYIKIKNTTDKELSNVVEFSYPILDYIYVMEYRDSKVINEYLTGDMTKYNTRKMDVNNLVFPYELLPNETKEFIFKINSQGALNVGMAFSSKDEYYSNSKNRDFILGSYYGAVFIMLLYNMVLYLMIKERVYLDYVAFHFFYLFLQLGLNGLTFSFFFQNYPEVNNYFILFMLILANYFSVVFVLSFLELKKYTIKLYYYFKLIMMLYIIMIFATFFISFSLVLELTIALSIISVCSLFITGIYILYIFRSISSKFFVIAWSSLLIGVLLTQLQYVGFLNMNPIVLYGSQIGAFIELALLSFALAYRYNNVFVKLVDKESEVRVLNSSLQEKVDEQTMKLKLMIKELNHRVKNNFQVILTCLWAQKRSMYDESSLKALDQTTKRIYAISSLHELLDVSDNVSINISTYIDEIVNSFKSDDRDIVYNTKIKDITINYDEAVSIGLILNELLTNSNKYAFEFTSEPRVDVEFYQSENRQNYVFKYSDNGIGFDVDILSNNSGFGYDLIYGFTQKMDSAKLSLISEHGMELIIEFSKKSESK